MQLREERPTLEEFLSWPEEKPYLELIDGKVRQKTMPDFPHGVLQAEFTVALRSWCQPAAGWTMTEMRCILTADNKEHVVLPDVAWWSRAQLPDPAAGPTRVPPTLAVEILSPSDRYGEVQDKVMVYLTAGVRVVWIVDPLARNVTVYYPDRSPEVVASPRKLTGEALPGLAVSLADMFAGCEPAPKVQE